MTGIIFGYLSCGLTHGVHMPSGQSGIGEPGHREYTLYSVQTRSADIAMNRTQSWSPMKLVFTVI